MKRQFIIYTLKLFKLESFNVETPVKTAINMEGMIKISLKTSKKRKIFIFTSGICA